MANTFEARGLKVLAAVLVHVRIGYRAGHPTRFLVLPGTAMDECDRRR